MMHFFLLMNKQGKVRLAKWFSTYPQRERTRITKEVANLVLPRDSQLCNFIDWRNLKLVYKRYASLYFVTAIDPDDNELVTLDMIHHFVEVLDKHFSNVCELDLVFHFYKAYWLMDEVFLAGLSDIRSLPNYLSFIVEHIVELHKADGDLRRNAGAKQTCCHSLGEGTRRLG